MQKPIYSIKNLTLDDNKNTIIKIKKFDLHRGAMYLFNGHVGSGKTTLLNLFCKQKKVPSNMLFYEGKDLNDLSVSEYQKEITYIKEKNKIPWFAGTCEKYLKNKIKENRNNTKVDSIFNKICNSMKISNTTINRNVSELTEGEFRWLLLAGSIALDKKVLFIDYIDMYLDYNKRMILNRLLKRKTSYDGVTVIATTYNPEGFKMSTSVHIKLDKGRITQLRSTPNKSK
tara:strand:+ start:551 stop:1237 length:687 start_codon:yes stop_codon:yes gene_type:complete